MATAVLLGVVVSCEPKTASAPKETTPAATPSVTSTQIFQVNGVIVELLPTEKSARIRHEEIPDYMPAMTMSFDVLDTNELAGLAVGDPVAFRMTVTDTTGWIDQIKKRDVDPADANKNILPANAPMRLVRDVEPLAVGDLLPDYRFTNQLGRAVNLAEFRGNALAITFIFTRCPYPTYCPLMSNNFKAAHDALRQNPGSPTNWHLLEITIDPDFDTPERLKGYAGMYKADPTRWSFLTGALIDVTAITEQFGLQFTREPGGGISHNLRTVVIDASGRAQKIIAENKWTAEELVEEVIKAAAKR
ncbi:MAG: SCO family protein [Verrucomicrobiota bacterium]